MLDKLAFRVFIWLAATAWAAGVAGETTWTDHEMEDFLLRAEIVRMERLEIGVTGSQRATLSLDGRTHDAHVQVVDIVKHNARVGQRTALIFRDRYLYNVAAYRLDRMLDLGMVPVSVERTVAGERSALTWWVDDVLMMERDRVEKRIRPPGSLAWVKQTYRRRIFNELVYNTDFNLGNQLITGDWKVWLIDFTRAFWPVRKLFKLENLWQADGPLLERMRALTQEQVDDRLSCCLTRRERRALLVRRDLIVRHFEQSAARPSDPIQSGRQPPPNSDVLMRSAPSTCKTTCTMPSSSAAASPVWRRPIVCRRTRPLRTVRSATS